jgi:hypothetical protein
MTEIEYAELQRRHGGRYVARRGNDVIASAGSYRELSAQLDRLAARRADLVVEYVEPPDVVSAY